MTTKKIKYKTNHSFPDGTISIDMGKKDKDLILNLLNLAGIRIYSVDDYVQDYTKIEIMDKNNANSYTFWLLPSSISLIDKYNEED